MTRATAALAALAALVALSGCDEGSPTCDSGEERAAGECVRPVALRLNSVGFLADGPKRATSPGSPGDFDVLRADGSVAYSGSADGPVKTEDGQDVSVLDFSDLDELGSFVVDAKGIGRSASFEIGRDAYVDGLKTVMLSFYGQRCGTAVTLEHAGERFTHGECHAQDAHIDHVFGLTGKKESLYGWHDAGDYGKYTVNGAFTAALLLKSWEHFESSLADLELQIPERDGPIPDFLAEPKFELDWLLTTQFEGGQVSHKVTALQFEALEVAPERDAQRRYFAPTGTAATASFAAVMAQAARIYEPYDSEFAATCLSAAQLSYGYLTQTTEQKPDLSKFATGGYETSDADDRIWAAAEIWETTGDAAALADFEARADNVIAQIEWDWSNVGNLGVFTYLLSERAGRNPDLVAKLESSAVGNADRIVTTVSDHAYGRGIGAKYYWGTNGTTVRIAMNLVVADRLTPRPEYRAAALAQIDYVLGRNPYGRSMVTGLGHKPPAHPHHRPSVADGQLTPWPGLLVGGPWPDPGSWADLSDDFKTNEVAINWSGALAYALAASLP